MSEIKFDAVAYSKIIFHAAKYPHCSVNGILLADAAKCKEPNKLKELIIVDAVPLFHLCLHVSPMVEIALSQIDAWANDNDLIIVGYYVANEGFNDNTIEKCSNSSYKIAEKIAEQFSAALFVVVDNTKMAHNREEVAVNTWQFNDGKWKQKTDVPRLMPAETIDAVSSLLRQGIKDVVVDFDNHLDDVTSDWTNKELEKNIKEVLNLCV